MSLFSLMDGEHLAGFMFRRHIFSGNNVDRKFSYDLTVRMAGWRVLPKRNIEEGSFDTYRKHTLLSLFRPTSEPCSWEPYHLIRHRVDYVSTSILYCPLCFQSQIKEYGFYWFRREWLIYNTDVCLIHNCKLSHLQCTNCNWANDVSIFLRGRCSKCHGKLTFQNPIYASNIPPIISWANQILEMDMPHFSKRLIKMLLCKNYESMVGNSNTTNRNLAFYLFKKCENNAGNHLDEHPSWQMNRSHMYQQIETFLIGDNRYETIPFLIFWKLMILEFTTFQRFFDHLSSISVLKIDKDSFKHPISFLDTD